MAEDYCGGDYLQDIVESDLLDLGGQPWLEHARDEAGRHVEVHNPWDGHRLSVSERGAPLQNTIFNLGRDRCREQLRAGDELVVTRLDRVGRSVTHLIEVVAELGERGIELMVLNQGIDTTSPGGWLLFHVLAAMSEFVGDLISENTKDGLATARARGRVGGRPSVMTPAKLRVARQLHEGGEHTITEIAETIGVGRATMYRHFDGARGVPVER